MIIGQDCLLNNLMHGMRFKMYQLNNRYWWFTIFVRLAYYSLPKGKSKYLFAMCMRDFYNTAKKL